MKNRNNIAEYEFAQKTVKCYCESRKIPYYLIVNDEENVKGCTMTDVSLREMGTKNHRFINKIELLGLYVTSRTAKKGVKPAS